MRSAEPKCSLNRVVYTGSSLRQVGSGGKAFQAEGMAGRESAWCFPRTARRNRGWREKREKGAWWTQSGKVGRGSPHRTEM